MHKKRRTAIYYAAGIREMNRVTKQDRMCVMLCGFDKGALTPCAQKADQSAGSHAHENICKIRM